MKKGMYMILIFLVIASITGVGLAAQPSDPFSMPRIPYVLPVVQPSWIPIPLPPLPDPFVAVWDAITGLQTHDTAQDAVIASLKTRVDALEAAQVAQPSIWRGTFTGSTTVALPTGYATADCTIYVIPDAEQFGTTAGVQPIREVVSTHFWTGANWALNSRSYYTDNGGNSLNFENPAQYLMICQK